MNIIQDISQYLGKTFGFYSEYVELFILTTLIFIFFGIYIDNRVESFGTEYTKEVEFTCDLVREEDWKESNEMVDELFQKLETQRDFWLRVLDHKYYDDIKLELSLVQNAVDCEDKVRALENLEKIKSILSNIIADGKCDLNYIF